MKRVELEKKVISENEKLARANREKYAREGTFVLNLVSSPGSGKTRLIEETAKRLRDEVRMLVLTGDLMTENDANRVARHGVDAVQITTGGACHLDARMVDEKLEPFKDRPFDLVIVENVGNLVCTAEFDTGAIRNAMILSVPEGDDKPLKYPLMFTVCDVLIVNKIDYLDYSDFDIDALRKRVLNPNSKIKIFEISCKTGKGISAWTDWLKEEVSLWTKF